MTSIALRSQEFTQRGELLGEQLRSRATDRIGDAIMGIPGIFERIQERRFRQEQSERQFGVQQDQLGIQRDRLDLATDEVAIREKVAQSDLLHRQAQIDIIRQKMEFAASAQGLKQQDLNNRMLSAQVDAEVAMSSLRVAQTANEEDELRLRKAEVGGFNFRDMSDELQQKFIAAGGTQVGGVIKLPEDMSEEQVDEFRSSVMDLDSVGDLPERKEERFIIQARMDSIAEQIKLFIGSLGGIPAKEKDKEELDRLLGELQGASKDLADLRSKPPETAPPPVEVPRPDEEEAREDAGAVRAPQESVQALPPRARIPIAIGTSFPDGVARTYNSNPVFQTGTLFGQLAESFGQRDGKPDRDAPFWDAMLRLRAHYGTRLKDKIAKMKGRDLLPTDPMLVVIEALIKNPIGMEVFLQEIGAPQQMVQQILDMMKEREDG